MESQKALFLSHAHADVGMASAFAAWLEGAFDPPVQVICTSRPKDHIASGMVTGGILARLKRCDVALAFLTPQAMASPWVYYEMGAAQALGKVFVPCMTGRLSYQDLPPQAYEYQGALLQREDEIRRLIQGLSQILDLSVRDGLDMTSLVGQMEVASHKRAGTPAVG
jgi:hypothetical protein